MADLNETNRAEIARLGYDEDTFIYEPESFVGNHLMKTVALNGYLYASRVAGFSPGSAGTSSLPVPTRLTLARVRRRPSTPPTPASAQSCTLPSGTCGMRRGSSTSPLLPLCPGIPLLGARVTTVKVSDVPAWEQDLEHTNERGGRRQDKEDLMKKFRDLGYM